MSKKRTIEDFIAESKIKHGDEAYKYDKCLEYINNKTPLQLYCNIHKEYFFVSTNDHLGKKLCGCPKCGLEKRKPSKTPKTFEEFVLKAKEIHGDKYTYVDHLESYGNDELVNIICPVHGVFTKKVGEHIRSSRKGGGCQKCSREELTKMSSSTKDHFINKASDIHNNKYDYSLLPTILVGSHVNIICPIHGKFKQFKNNHLQGHGCPRCSNKISKPEEQIVDFIKTLKPNIQIVQSYRPKWLNGKEIDIYIPDFNLGIEYNGSIYHHSSKSAYLNSFLQKTSKSPMYHFDKWKLCYDNGVTLLSIYDFYWKIPNKQLIYQSKISHYLQLDNRIYARKCVIKEITNIEAYEFYETNHLEGKGFSYKEPKSFGLFYQNKLVMVITIGKFYNQSIKTFKYKVHRVCTLLNTTIVGGLSKLLTYLKSEYFDFIYQIVLSTGASTLNMSNKFTYLKPRYFWVNSVTLEYYSRNYTQKQVLQKHFNEPLLPDDTENTYMERLGFIKVYDNGLAEISY